MRSKGNRRKVLRVSVTLQRGEFPFILSPLEPQLSLSLELVDIISVEL